MYAKLAYQLIPVFLPLSSCLVSLFKFSELSLTPASTKTAGEFCPPVVTVLGSALRPETNIQF